MNTHPPPDRRSRPLLAVLLAGLLVLSGSAPAAGEVWIRVDTGHRVLDVMQGDTVLRSFDNISVGSNGVTHAKLLHDRTTPLGSYHVRRINEESRFVLFFGFDYPNLEQAQQAFQSGIISYEELKAIRYAHYLGKEPPSNTPLGGMIGIHGVGSGDERIHEAFNWTDGCIAVTNDEVIELAQWIHLGTRVEVE